MSATSSSPAASPHNNGTARARTMSCVDCKRIKRRCDKGLPCSECVKTNRNCEYRDPADDGITGPIQSAKDINALTFGTLMDILIQKQRVKETVALYFNSVGSWFTIIERATFEQQLEEKWDQLPAEMSILALCMALVARPPNQKPSKVGDAAYLSTKSILSLVQSKVDISISMLQAELLVAMYEFSQLMSQQAYLSLGRCLQMTKALGWHNAAVWTDERKAIEPRNLKLCSILWWSIVHVDCLLYVGYDNQTFPMHTAGLAQISGIPLPEAMDPYLPGGLPYAFNGQQQGLRQPDNTRIEGMVVPEARSAWYLSCVLHRLLNPGLPSIVDLRTLSDNIWQHGKDAEAANRNAAVATDLIALMKLSQPSLFSTMGPMLDENHFLAVRQIKLSTDIIHGKIGKAAETQGPYWAFAMSYAALLLIAHCDDVLQDVDWYNKVGTIQGSLARVSQRWKIAEKYCESVRIALDNRLTGYAS